MNCMKTFLIVVGAFAASSLAGPAFAAAQPHGQPGAANGHTCGMPGATSTPGGSASAAGSPFNPMGQAGNVYAGNPGTASAAHSGSPLTAISEYDVACFNVTPP
jgi:hypothetical protein